VVLSSKLILTAALAAVQLPPAGVDIKIQPQPQTATVGDPIRIEFDITLPPGYQLRFTDPGSQIGDFTVLQGFAPPAAPGTGAGQGAPPGISRREGKPGEPAHQSAQLIVALYKTGEVEFPPFPFIITDREGKQFTVSSPSVKVRIQSVLTEKDQELAPLRRQAEIPEPVRWLLWFALALFMLLTAILWYWWWQRRRRPALPPPFRAQLDPLDLAEAELRDLIGRNLPGKGMIKQFYVALSEILKKVIEAGYGIQTVEKTTTEIMEQLRSGSMTGTGKESLERVEWLLVGCDLVKFAKYVPPQTENASAVRDAFKLLAECRARKTPAPVAGTEPAAGIS